MFRKIDCVRLQVPDIESALAFYRDRLGLKLVWRRGSKEAGLSLLETNTEIVLVSEKIEGIEVDMLVESADAAAAEFVKLGGRIVFEPFDIPIGRCAVVEDPWKNRFVILDNRKGPLVTDGEGNVI